MAVPPAVRVMETQARTYRRTWRGSVITTFLNPVLYLAAMGLGLGTLVDAGSGDASLDGVSYLEFLAPGLLAATAMQIGAGDSSWPVMAGMKFLKTYEAALSTPIRSRDLVYGHLLWVTVRVAMTTVTFAFVMMLFGATSPGGALRSQLPAILTGAVFAAAVTAYTAPLHSEYAVSSLFRFAIIPMFLFSGVFFPITQLPVWLQPLAYLTPLWHGVELTRAAALESAPAWQPALHISYLVLWLVAGTGLALRNFERRLTK